NNGEPSPGGAKESACRGNHCPAHGTTLRPRPARRRRQSTPARTYNDSIPIDPRPHPPRPRITQRRTHHARGNRSAECSVKFRVSSFEKIRYPLETRNPKLETLPPPSRRPLASRTRRPRLWPVARTTK